MNINAQFHAVGKVWEHSWDSDLNTAHPKDVTDFALEMEAAHPNKRHVIHFVQPHTPFIGEVGKEIRGGGFSGDGVIRDTTAQESVFDRLRRGEISAKKVRAAYRENLEATMPHIRRLLDELPGKTVVTSDHGEAFGEGGVYGHPPFTFIEELQKVPWLVVESDSRKEIIRDSAGDKTGAIDETVEERLKDLGYQE